MLMRSNIRSGGVFGQEVHSDHEDDIVRLKGNTMELGCCTVIFDQQFQSITTIIWRSRNVSIPKTIIF
jgi:hypothetical protein